MKWFFRKTKAARAYLFAQEFRRRGIDTPREVAYIETGGGRLFLTGYFVSLEAPGTETHLLLREVKDFSHELADAVAVTYESNGNNVDFMDGLPIGTQTYDHIFYLKPGEAAQCTGIPEGVRYYVQEVDVSGAYYDTVMINEADMGGEGGIPEDDNVTATSSSKTIQERQRVLFRNRCSEKNQRDLRITKRVDNPTDDGATFEFRVRL